MAGVESPARSNTDAFASCEGSTSSSQPADGSATKEASPFPDRDSTSALAVQDEFLQPPSTAAAFHVHANKWHEQVARNLYYDSAAAASLRAETAPLQAESTHCNSFDASSLVCNATLRQPRACSQPHNCVNPATPEAQENAAPEPSPSQSAARTRYVRQDSCSGPFLGRPNATWRRVSCRDTRSFGHQSCGRARASSLKAVHQLLDELQARPSSHHRQRGSSRSSVANSRAASRRHSASLQEVAAAEQPSSSTPTEAASCGHAAELDQGAQDTAASAANSHKQPMVHWQLDSDNTGHASHDVTAAVSNPAPTRPLLLQHVSQESDLHGSGRDRDTDICCASSSHESLEALNQPAALTEPAAELHSDGSHMHAVGHTADNRAHCGSFAAAASTTSSEEADAPAAAPALPSTNGQAVVLTDRDANAAVCQDTPIRTAADVQPSHAGKSEHAVPQVVHTGTTMDEEMHRGDLGPAANGPSKGVLVVQKDGYQRTQTARRAKRTAARLRLCRNALRVRLQLSTACSTALLAAFHVCTLRKHAPFLHDVALGTLRWKSAAAPGLTLQLVCVPCPFQRDSINT